MKIAFGSLNKSELAWGAAFGAVFVFKIGFLALLIAPFTAVLWALGGLSATQGGNKLFRRLACPGIPALAVYLTHGMQFDVLFSWSFAFFPLCLGYGLPSTQPPDAGSWLGQVAFKITKGSQFWSDVLVRGTIFALLMLAFLPAWLVK